MLNQPQTQQQHYTPSNAKTTSPRTRGADRHLTHTHTNTDRPTPTHTHTHTHTHTRAHAHTAQTHTSSSSFSSSSSSLRTILRFLGAVAFAGGLLAVFFAGDFFLAFAGLSLGGSKQSEQMRRII